MSALGHQITTRYDRHDVLCIGFGVSALSLAVAHRERCPKTDIVFLESRSQAAWQGLRKLPGRDMETSFINDLITTENPRSKYSFVKYLHATDRLVNFTNVGKVKPSGELFEDYLRWIASKFEASIRWSTSAVALEPTMDRAGIVDQWKVAAQNTSTGDRTILTAKRVIIATGNQPNIPPSLQPVGSSLVHSSQCTDVLQSQLQGVKSGANIAIVGDGQAAAELLEYLHGIRGKHTATLFAEHGTLQADAQSSFEHDLESQPPTQPLRRLPPEMRTSGHSTNSSSVSAALIERLYGLQYEQRVSEPDEQRWRFQIRTTCKISAAQALPDGRVSLATVNEHTSQVSKEPRPFDLVIAATGHTQHEQERLLRPLGTLLDNRNISVDANYRVNLRKRGVVNGRGLWLLGSLAPERYVSTSFQLASRSPFCNEISGLTKPRLEMRYSAY
jgi:L-ornithine N5-monooxygenase